MEDSSNPPSGLVPHLYIPVWQSTLCMPGVPAVLVLLGFNPAAIPASHSVVVCGVEDGRVIRWAEVVVLLLHPLLLVPTLVLGGQQRRRGSAVMVVNVAPSSCPAGDHVKLTCQRLVCLPDVLHLACTMHK